MMHPEAWSKILPPASTEREEELAAEAWRERELESAAAAGECSDGLMTGRLGRLARFAPSVGARCAGGGVAGEKSSAGRDGLEECVSEHSSSCCGPLWPGNLLMAVTGWRSA
jgi:hypothetical protein